MGQKESLENEISSITIDSRTSKKADLYIAIIGKNHDGNQFTQEVLDNGIKFAIVSDSAFHSERTILVDNG